MGSFFTQKNLAAIIEFLKAIFSGSAEGTPAAPADKGFTRKKLAEIAEREAKLNLAWVPGGEARKYTKDFEPVFGAGRFEWCGAFTRWCCKEAGILDMPISPIWESYTLALVETWQQWAIVKGFYIDNDETFIPEAGDIVIFDWNQTNVNQPDLNWDSHVGVFLRMNGTKFVCAEGNTSNATNVMERSRVNIQGFVRIPDGYLFNPQAIVAPTPLPASPAPTPVDAAATFDRLVEEVLLVEGGYSDDPDDAGGATNFGITIGALSQYLGRGATKEEVRNLSRETAKAIYKKFYWDPLNLDQVKSPILAQILFDQGVNRGIGTAAMDVEKALGVTVDATIDADTLAALNSADPRKLGAKLVKLAQHAYVGIVVRRPTQIKFLAGWLNRTHKLMDLLV